MKNTSFTEVPLGAILPGQRQFIVGVTVDDDARPLHIELPGQIVQCETQRDFGLKPWARLVSNAGSYRRSAIVTAAVADEEALDAELAGFRERVAAKPPTSFAVRLTSKDTVGQALDALERAGRGCECDGDTATARVTIPGALSVGFGWNDGEEIWSRPVAAPIMLAWSYGPEDGVFVFDCHSVWFGWIDRSTACEGPCTKPKDCMCNDGKWRFNCKGWRTCWCV